MRRTLVIIASLLLANAAALGELVFLTADREVSMPAFCSAPDPITSSGLGFFDARVEQYWGFAEQRSWISSNSIFASGKAVGTMGGINCLESSYSKVFVAFEIAEATAYSIRGTHTLEIKNNLGVSDVRTRIEDSAGVVVVEFLGEGVVDLHGVLAPGVYTYKHQAWVIGMEIATSTFDVRLTLPSPGSGAFIATGAILLARRRWG